MRATAPEKPSRTVFLLTAISSIGQYASSVYLPSFPAIALALSADIATVQLTLSVFLFAFAAGQLVVGPVCDRYGRRPVMMAGFAFFIAGSYAAATASAIEAVFVGRVLQAIGAAMTTVTTRAAVRDLFSGAEMARAMALMAMVFGIVPAVAPLIGGLLQDAFGWTAPMWSAVAIGVVAALLALAGFKETIRERLPSLDLLGAVMAYRPIIGSRHFLAFAMASLFGLAGLFSFLSGSPGVFIRQFGVSPTEYGFYPPFGVAGFVIGASVARRMAGRVEAAVLLRRAILVEILAAGAMFALPIAGLFHAIPVTVCMFAYGLGFGVVVPASLAAAIGRFPDRAGTASALMGFFQLLGSTLGTVVTSLLNGPLAERAFPTSMAAAAVIGAAAFLVLLPSERR